MLAQAALVCFCLNMQWFWCIAMFSFLALIVHVSVALNTSLD
jgi:hypothetical protein